MWQEQHLLPYLVPPYAALVASIHIGYGSDLGLAPGIGSGVWIRQDHYNREVSLPFVWLAGV